MSNSIPADQNADECFRLLEARQELWHRAEGWQKLQLVLVVLVPIIGAVFAMLLPDQRLHISLGAVGIALLDAVWIDRSYRAAIKKAAKASEHFDTKLLELPWNRLAAGPPLPAEELREATKAWRKRGSERVLKDWYPVRVGDAPMPLARVLCQRTNLFYDSALRRSYSRSVFIALASIGVGILAFGLLREASINSLLLAFLLPISPLAIFSLRDSLRQIDAAAVNDQIKVEAEKVVERVIQGQCSPEECFQSSRELQAAIFVSRASNPLIIPGYYDWQRPRLEEQMKDGAEEWLSRAGL